MFLFPFYVLSRFQNSTVKSCFAISSYSTQLARYLKLILFL
jgi:hypothetical protein